MPTLPALLTPPTPAPLAHLPYPSLGYLTRRQPPGGGTPPGLEALDAGSLDGLAVAG